ncbi:endonuclease/exonuclease/phosphatase family protein [Streptomyces sp. NP160]|uniref:endonuclease/exonuclease/phosphatase family protein n=1 Tax=Streptomyces sp. NP160 TaxID=2586637 RepID=UPI0015D5D108|nr:endonuclease/exonuclease/phosphatase family protein [Streptomyces sp. NP160]
MDLPRRRAGLSAWAGRYGTAASLALLAVAVLGDSTAETYAIALVAFWWLLPAVPLLAVALARQWWRGAAALVAPAVVAASTWGPLLWPVPPGGPADLRVATYNATHGAGTDGVLALAAQHHPDVLLLQELTPRQVGALDRQLADAYPYRSFGPLDDRQRDGDAVLSRFPVTAVEPVTGLPAGARPADLVRLDVEGRPTSVLSVHLASPCLLCDGDADGYNPAGGTSQSARVRVAEAQRYADLAAQRQAQGDLVVVAGDINSSELNRPLRVLTGQGLEDVQAEVGRRPQLTRGPGPGLARVDVVLVAGLVPLRTWEGRRGPSTHSPVLADLALPR